MTIRGALGMLALGLSATVLAVACGGEAPGLVGLPLDAGMDVTEAESTSPDAAPDTTAPDAAPDTSPGADSAHPIDSAVVDAPEEDRATPPDTAPPDTAPPDTGAGCPGCVMLPPPELTPGTSGSNN